MSGTEGCSWYGDDFCAICHLKFAESPGDKVTLGNKALNTLAEYSVKREDIELKSYLDSSPAVVNVHVDCRKTYTKPCRKSGNAAAPNQGQQQPMKRLRSSFDVFDWHIHCLFCSKLVTVGQDSHTAMTFQIKTTVEKKCLERDDEWGREVYGRVSTCTDFPSAEATYHGQCLRNFYTGRQLPGVGSTRDDWRQHDVKRENFEIACQWLEREAGDELHSVTELHDRMVKACGSADLVYSVKWLKQLLLDKYGDHVFFATVEGKNDVVCFKDMASYIINAKWYQEREEKIEDESKRLVLAAAKLLKDDIRRKWYDTGVYPEAHDVGNIVEGKSWLPPLLGYFLQELLLDEEKQVSVGQCIVQAAKSKAVIPPLLLGLGVELDLKFRSKWLIDHLYNLGFSVTYDEIKRYKQSVLVANQESPMLPTYPHSFTQWVADNVDHNTVTLDGLGTFHGMGIIAASTRTSPSASSFIRKKVVRIAKCSVKDLTKNRGIPVLSYCAPVKPGLSSISFNSISSLLSPLTLPSLYNCNLLWRCGWMARDSTETVTDVPNWSGYMQHVSKGDHTSAAMVTFLPIIDLNPSDNHCIYSTLCFIDQQAKQLNITNPCVTFDAPLWIKAVEILQATGMNKTMVCRLGGFHTMMSFLGSIGTLMAGSGLSDALEVCYGPNAVEHMMTGKAVSRAVRAHFMVDAALGRLLLRCLLSSDDDGDTQRDGMLTTEQVNSVRTMFDVSMNAGFLPSFEEESFLNLQTALNDLCDSLKHKSRTCKLWLQYLDYVNLLKIFIMAERTGNWNLHLFAVKNMLNLFAATGHNQYTKNARLYLDIMTNLHTTHPWLHQQFTQHGFHTIRRSDRYWAGLWSDLVIEQTLMRTVKSKGGLTHGSGMTDSVRLVWTESMHQSAAMHEAMSTFTKSEVEWETEHSDLSKSRMNRDRKDVESLAAWFGERNPFKCNNTSLRCLSTGKTAVDGDGINCDAVEEVGAAIHAAMDGVTFTNVKLRKKDQIKTLERLEKGVLSDHKEVFIHTTHLFNRLIVLVERTTDMGPYFCYELTPQPAALFKDSRMRKPDKASLGNFLTKTAIVTGYNGRPQHVLDGGCLLHKVKWPKIGTYLDVIQLYVRHIKHNFGSVAVIVFDGYHASTKDHEHQRRSASTGKISADVLVAENMCVHSSQQEFLANSHNKSNFIQLLSKHLEVNGFDVRQARDDADTEIAKAALLMANQNRVTTVVADDTDILVLLVHHLRPAMADIYLLMQPTSGKNKGPRIINIREVQQHIGSVATKHILAIHALSGCDTTSALYGHGKVSVYKRLTAGVEAVNNLEVLSNPNASQDEVATAGSQLLALIYGGKLTDQLNSLRHSAYMNMCAVSSSRPVPERLPPTEHAACFHSLRTHIQIIQWLQLSTAVLDPAVWGWQFNNGNYEPIAMQQEPGPPELLKVIRCSCKSSNPNQCGGNACTCRKNGLLCVSACGKCHGRDCKNIQQVISEDGEGSEDGAVFDTFADSSDFYNDEDIG